MRAQDPPGRSQEALRNVYHSMLAVHTRLARLEKQVFMLHVTPPDGDAAHTAVDVESYDIPDDVPMGNPKTTQTLHVHKNGYPGSWQVDEPGAKERHANGGGHAARHANGGSPMDYIDAGPMDHIDAFVPGRRDADEGMNRSMDSVDGFVDRDQMFEELSQAAQVTVVPASRIGFGRAPPPRAATAEEMVHLYLLGKTQATMVKHGLRDAYSYNVKVTQSVEAWTDKCRQLVERTAQTRDPSRDPRKTLMDFTRLSVPQQLGTLRRVECQGQARNGTTMELASIYLCGHGPITEGGAVLHNRCDRWTDKYEHWFRHSHMNGRWGSTCCCQ